MIELILFSIVCVFIATVAYIYIADKVSHKNKIKIDLLKDRK
jgi:hypothetical protein